MKQHRTVGGESGFQQDLDILILFNEHHVSLRGAECSTEQPSMMKAGFTPFTLLKSKALELLVQVTPLIMAKPGLNLKHSLLTNKKVKKEIKKRKRGKEFICLAVTHFNFVQS